jgi:hypothetical protein
LTGGGTSGSGTSLTVIDGGINQVSSLTDLTNVLGGIN